MTPARIPLDNLLLQGGDRPSAIRLFAPLKLAKLPFSAHPRFGRTLRLGVTFGLSVTLSDPGAPAILPPTRD